MSITRPALAAAGHSYSIGPMTEHDLLEVVQIEESSGLSRWGWAAYYAELQGQHSDLMLVARLEGPPLSNPGHQVGGYIVARMAADELHINNFAVREGYRGRGMGRALLTRILTEAQKSGATRAFLELRAGNAAALALYEKCGFQITARRKNYYSDPLEDALVMTLQF